MEYDFTSFPFASPPSFFSFFYFFDNINVWWGLPLLCAVASNFCLVHPLPIFSIDCHNSFRDHHRDLSLTTTTFSLLSFVVVVALHNNPLSFASRHVSRQMARLYCMLVVVMVVLLQLYMVAGNPWGKGHVGGVITKLHVVGDDSSVYDRDDSYERHGLVGVHKHHVVHW